MHCAKLTFSYLRSDIGRQNYQPNQISGAETQGESGCQNFGPEFFRFAPLLFIKADPNRSLMRRARSAGCSPGTKSKNQPLGTGRAR
jgi:hypothetical protein